jgi:hypothetical protein
MSNKYSSPRLFLRKLVLVGARKEYVVPFHEGLNIIYGDFDTGKSSILNLVDYCLGASSVDLYAQLQETGKHCFLEIEISGKVYTIRRDLFNTKTEIEVFTGDLQSISEAFPTKYYANFSYHGELEYFSNFLLTNLGFPIIEIKQAPTKAYSKMNRLSFRDLFKFCYFNQDQVGSREILNSGNPIVATKNREVFKYILNVLDADAAQLHAAIAEATKSQTELRKKHNTVAFFLRDTDFKSQQALVENKESLDDEILAANEEIKRLNKQMLASSSMYSDLRQQIVEFDGLILNTLEEVETDDITLKNNILLKKEYQYDIQKIKAALEVAEKIEVPTEHSFSCPLCSTSVKVNDIKSNFNQHEKGSLETELRGIIKRVKELDSLIKDLKESIDVNQTLLSEYKSATSELRNRLDNETKGLVSPFVSQIESLSARKATLEESKRSTDYLLKIRQTLSDINKQTAVYDEQISLLNNKLALVTSNAPKIDDSLNKISDLLRDFLSSVQMKAVYGVSISEKSFLPLLRDVEYGKISSGGVRTLVSIGFIISLLRHSFDNNGINHPRLLMIDTIGKYLGKTSSKYTDTDDKHDNEFGVGQGDKQKYELMYRYLLALSVSEHGHQILVVDNDLPLSLEDTLQPLVVKHFDELGRNGLPKGFIDDIS